MPKKVVHSEPEYVVGSDTTRSPVAAEIDFARSIALPPPAASTPSDPEDAATASGTRSLGTSSQRLAAGRSSPEPDESRGRARRRAAGRADERDLAGGVQPPHSRGLERAGGEIGLDPGARDEGDAVPGGDRRLDGLLQAELEARLEVAQPRPGPPQLVLDHLAHSRALLHHDQRLLAQLRQRHRLPREAVARRTGEHDLVAEERLEDDTPVPPRGTDDAQLELALGDAVDHRLRIRDRERDRYLGVLALELAQEHRHDRAPRTGGGADLERPAELAPLARVQLVDQLALEREHALCAAVKSHPGLGRFHASPGAVEQLAPQPLLERADLKAHGRLGDAEPLGCLREALAFHHRAERRQLSRVHKHILCKALPCKAVPDARGRTL
jgi:hypothetical protein